MSESTTTTKSICGSEDHENTEFSDDQKSDDSLSGTDDQSRELSILPQKPKEVPLRREIQLPDELLCHVFDFLTPVELLNIERVCSHWLNISRKLWSLRRTVVASNGVPLRQVASKLYHSKHLTKLVIKNYFPSSRLAESLILMAQSAPSIRSIELVDCELANEVLKAIGNGWPWLERIKLHYFTNNHERQREYPLEPDFDEGLHHLFTMCRSLSHVDLCLDRLPLPKIVALLDPVKIQAISLRSYFYRAEFFEDLFTALYAMVNLQSLSLHFIFDQHITSWWPEHAMINFLEKLAGLAPNISHLHLMFAEHFFRQTTPLWHFATACRHFSQLTHIDLNDNSGLETRDMQIIGLYCLQVKSLTLANAKLGTEQGLEYIAGCSKLQSLDISGTKYYDFDTRTYLPISSLSIKFLDRMTSIKHLKVNECIGLTPKSLYQALSTMAKLGSLETVEAKKVNACNHDFIAALYSALNPLQVSISQSGRWLRVDTDKHVLDNSPLLHNARGVSADPSCKGIVVWPSSKDQQLSTMIEGEPQAQFGRRTAAKVLCCECGVPIESNAVNMCVACVRARVDITEGIPHNTQLNWCKFCDRYLQPPDSWVAAPLESKELLSVCLKRIKTSLIRVRLVDAAFVWTEPHSRRIKMKITIQKEVLGGAILQQSVIIEYVVQQQMCDDCRRAEAKDFWRAVVQIRQRCEHRKTLFYMEQLILKAKAHLTTTGIKPMPAGIDFFYAKQQDARKLYEFIQASLPVKMTHAQELMTHDAKNNVFDYKHTYCIEVAPICKDNVVCLPKKLAQQLGNLGQFCVVTRVSVSIHLIDPANGQCADISSAVYWREPFESLCQPRQLTEYTVIDCELIDCPTRGVGHGQVSMKHTIADVWVQRSSELGQSDAPTFNTRTHLGNILSPGDTVAGFDVLNCNVNNAIFDAVPRENLPDVILIKKVYSRDMRKRRRVWKLARLAEDMLETASIERDFDDFLDDLEEEPKLRTGINIYKDKAKQERVMAVEMDDEDEAPGISLQASHFVEMLDDLNLEDTAANLVAEFAEQNGEQME